MLEVADVCILCGEVHPVRNYGLQHGDRGECPRVIMGRFPLLSHAEVDAIATEDHLRGSTSKRIREYESPPTPRPSQSKDAPDFASTPSGRPRTMGLPWLPPPDLGTVI